MYGTGGSRRRPADGLACSSLKQRTPAAKGRTAPTASRCTRRSSAASDTRGAALRVLPSELSLQERCCPVERHSCLVEHRRVGLEDGRDAWGDREFSDRLPDPQRDALGWRLFISRHAVEYHLRKAFTKLGNRPRTKLAALLRWHVGPQTTEFRDANEYLAVAEIEFDDKAVQQLSTLERRCAER